MDPFAAFICKSCRKKPLCPTHRDEEYRGVCIRCASTLRAKKLADLRAGLSSIKAFLRLMQFLFLLFAVMFIVERLMPGMAPEFLLENFLVKYLYVWGALSALGFVVMYVVYLGQKSSVSRLETEISGKRTAAFVHRAR